MSAEQHVGERVAALHAGVPAEQDGRDVVDPFLHENRAGADHDDDGARVGRRDRTDGLDVLGPQVQVAAIAAGGPAAHDAQALAHRGHDGVAIGALGVVDGVRVEA
ncbi:Uncharacterised protein [Mycobacteroides abscessus]|nr:Uncharacterised protein [Mycobacteroides abscessus]